MLWLASAATSWGNRGVSSRDLGNLWGEHHTLLSVNPFPCLGLDFVTSCTYIRLSWQGQLIHSSVPVWLCLICFPSDPDSEPCFGMQCEARGPLVRHVHSTEWGSGLEGSMEAGLGWASDYDERTESCFLLVPD